MFTFSEFINMLRIVPLAAGLLFLSAPAFVQPQDPSQLPALAVQQSTPAATPVEPGTGPDASGLPRPDLGAMKKAASALPDAQGIAPAQAPAPAPGLPPGFYIQQRRSSWGKSLFSRDTATYYVKFGDQGLGAVAQFGGARKSFAYTDAGKNMVAEGRERHFPMGSAVEVKDASGRQIGTVKEELVNSFAISGKPYTRYSILDANGKETAVYEKHETDATRAPTILRDLSGRTLAEARYKVTGGLFLSTKRWDVATYDPQVVDSRLLVIMLVYESTDKP